MSALDGLFGLRRILLNGALLDFRQTLNFLGGWTITPGVDADGNKTLELTAPGGGGGGTGDVVGPGASVADRIPVFNGTTGKLLKDGGATIASVLASALAAAQSYANGIGAAVTALIPAPGGAPSNVTKAAAAAGSSDDYARQDHKHDVTTAAAGAFNAAGEAAAEGGSTSLARADHKHSIVGTLPVANGGTGLTTAPAGKQLIANAAGTGWLARGPASASLVANTALSKSVADGYRFYTDDAALSTGRTITFGTGGSPADGVVVNFVCTVTSANPYTLDYGTGTMVIATSRNIDLRYDSVSASWALAGWQPVS